MKYGSRRKCKYKNVLIIEEAKKKKKGTILVFSQRTVVRVL